MAGEAGLSLFQDRGPLEFSAHVEKPQRIKCVVFSLALGHSRDSSKKKNSSVARTQNLEITRLMVLEPLRTGTLQLCLVLQSNTVSQVMLYWIVQPFWLKLRHNLSLPVLLCVASS